MSVVEKERSDEKYTGSYHSTNCDCEMEILFDACNLLNKMEYK